MAPNEPSNRQDDFLFEHRLRTFRPAPPPELRFATRVKPRLAFAAAAALIGITGLILLRHPDHPRQLVLQKQQITIPENRPLTDARLRAAFLAGDEQFNQLLDDASPAILPRGQSGTILFELGKE